MKLGPLSPLMPHRPESGKATGSDKAMRKAAEGLEATFLAEMLKPMGADAARENFGGGAGEEQFSSFLVQEEAQAMVSAGGIGLSEAIFQSMKAATEGGDAGQ